MARLIRGKHMLKSETKRSHKMVRSFLVTIGAKEDAERMARLGAAVGFTLETPAGTLYITMHEDDGYSVFMRFADPQLATAVLGSSYPGREPWGVNSFSGKWNLHCWAVDDYVKAEEVVERLRVALTDLMRQPVPTPEQIAEVRRRYPTYSERMERDDKTRLLP